MNPKERRKVEIDNLKEQRKEEVVSAAIEVFKEKGIDNTKMTDIAEKAEVGVASVYRYFKTKFDLVLAAATYLWREDIREIYEQFYDSAFKKLSGIEQIRKILDISIDLYKQYPQYLSFLEYFDNYIVKEKVPAEKLESYEKNVIDMRRGIFEALEQGKKDGSIKADIDNNTFYITITHALMSLSQKLILRGTILKSDYEVSGEDQIRLLVDMAVGYISK
ncbi:TetR/AcrR family transcriptional regulator [Clostridium thermarum]|uniref:TetR/AcrR family transcriptional regulator n=1 Tax=Clostridium thermarum TaxID=1716543 RepID=UPI0013D42D85|nr:TetR/AcrR family transcriptional regulator [Clostridium thermarum]